MTWTKKKILIGSAAALAMVAVGVGAVHAQGGWTKYGGSHRGMMGGQMMQQVMVQFDANGDGKLTKDEIVAGLGDRFAQYDSNGNGELSLDEFQGLITDVARPMMVRAFQFFDPNGDATVSKDELDAAVMRMVDRVDRNGDSVIDANDRHRWGGKDRGHGRYHYDGEGNDRGASHNGRDDQ